MKIRMFMYLLIDTFGEQIVIYCLSRNFFFNYTIVKKHQTFNSFSTQGFLFCCLLVYRSWNTNFSIQGSSAQGTALNPEWCIFASRSILSTQYL